MQSINKNGPTDWAESSEGRAEFKNSKDLFLRLMPGSNVVRVLTLPHLYTQHKHMPDGGRKYGYRINCSRTETQSCPLCDKGDRAKKRWLLGVIDRRSGAYKVLDISYAVFKGIKTLATSDDWGDPTQYDIDIVVSPAGGATGYYSVVPKPKKPLTDRDREVMDENGVADLERRVQAPTTERVEERLAKIAEEIGSGSNSGGSQSTSNDEDEGGDDGDANSFFKDYDKVKQKKASPF